MIKINLSNNGGFKWTSTDNKYFKGYCFFENEIYIEDIKKFNNLITDFKRDIHKLNGFYSFVSVEEDNIFATVDRTRSIPLFYYIKDNNFLLSDNPYWLIKNCGEIVIDEISKNEFIQTGYVTGSDTLFNGIKQINPGEMIAFNIETKEIETTQYYSFTHDIEKNNENELDILINQLELRHNSVFERLISTLDGRQVVIPLSGGYDSRLIASYLKKLNYHNVICYTYGVKNNNESKISKDIAAALGFEWIFVEYTKDRWKEMIDSTDYKKFTLFGSGVSSLPHIQDFIAVNYLRNDSRIDKDAIFIPGHSYDFLAGSHIPSNLKERNDFSHDELINLIIKKHYNLWTSHKNITQELKNKIEEIVGFSSTLSLEEICDKFELWDWKERQAKFIINSVRVYEYWGFEWRLPLWDNDLMQYWSKIPAAMRIDRNLFFIYINNKQNIPVKDYYKRGAKQKIISKVPENIYENFYRIKSIYRNNMNWFSIINVKEKLDFIFYKGYNINSIMAKRYINTLTNKANNIDIERYIDEVINSGGILNENIKK